MANNEQVFRIRGRVVDRTTKNGATGLRVEAWDRDLICNDMLGSAVTDAQGAFQIEFNKSYFQELFLDRKPDLFFKVFQDGSCIRSTEDAVLWNIEAGETEVVIDVALPQKPPSEPPSDQPPEVKGTVRLADGLPADKVLVSAFDRDLRNEEELGKAETNKEGFYKLQYRANQFLNAEKRGADLVVKAFAADGSFLAASPVLFNAPPSAEVNVTIPAATREPPSLFEKLSWSLEPLLKGVPLHDLREDEEHQDVSFLSGETGFEKSDVARFIIAYKLARQAIQAEFWFVLLRGSFYQFTETQTLEEQLGALLDSFPALDAATVGKSLTRGFNLKEIPASLQRNIDPWIKEFLLFIANKVVTDSDKPTFAKLALEDAGIADAAKQEAFALLFNQHKALTPELLEALEKKHSFTKAEIADLGTSFQLSELIRGDFSVVKMIKEKFEVRRPEQVRTLAKQSSDEWVRLVSQQHAAGKIKLPIEVRDTGGGVKLPEAEVYGKMLERQFREAFPTAAFAGGLERALEKKETNGLPRAEMMSRFLANHEEFELLNTPVDEFLDKNPQGATKAPAEDKDFGLQLKAVQRVFKLSPTFEATSTLLSDNLHSAQQIYRLGKSEFVRGYGNRPGFTAESAKVAWNRAADTHSAVLTVVGDLKALESASLPVALQNENHDLSKFPNWDNLFKAGDLCECEHCRSVLSPAAYFADLLMFLKDRKAKNPAETVKNILFQRRPDLGYLELNCENALTPLPYIDVVCEVLEDAVDAAGDNDLELAAVPANPATAKAAVATALHNALTDPVNDGKEKIGLGSDFSLSQVDPLDPKRWVVHGETVTYLLARRVGPDFFAKVLRNTKGSAEELRAYPRYVNPKAYKKLREAKYPLALPFDLFAEETRAAFQKSNLERWDLMRTFRGPAAPNNPTDGEIAAEYFGISVDPGSVFDEKRLILVADATVPGQEEIWGETVGNWPDKVGKVKTFLQKTGLEYNELLALLDLEFVNPAGDISIHHLDSSCDLDRKVIQGIDEIKLDRIHRFLRLWRKLKGWKMWELDLVIRHPKIGATGNPNGVLDEPFLINLFYFDRLRNRLGGKTSVEQVCALLRDLNTATRFSKQHEKREDALYQSLFQNKRLINPLDPAFQLDPGTGDLRAGLAITAHHPVVLAALGIREADLVLFKEWPKADGTRYISDDLTLSNLSFLWRHAWLSKQLNFKTEEWKTILKLFQQDIPTFASLEAAWKFVERIDLLKAAGFTPDDLDWLLAANRSAKAATKETDATRFLTALRKNLQAIQAEYDPAQYDFLTATPPTDIESLTTLLTSLLQKLSRDEATVGAFVNTLRGSVVLEASVEGLPVGFAFPALVTAAPNHIPIHYDEPATVLRFTGIMTEAQRTILLSGAVPAAVRSNPAYVNAIDRLLQQSLAIGGNYVSVEVEALLPGGVTLPVDRPSLPIRYNSTTQKLSFIGVMTDAERLALNAAGNPAAEIDRLFRFPRLAVKFFEPVFTAPLATLSAAIDFKAQLSADLAAKISYNAEQRLLRFAGIMTNSEQAALNALVPSVLPSDIAYHVAVNSLAIQPQAIALPDNRIWLTDNDIDPALPANNTVAKRLANAARKGLVYLSKTLAANAVVQQSSAQWGQTEALTRHLLEHFAVMPAIPPDPAKTTLSTYLTRIFAVTSGAVDYAAQKPTFDGWYWAGRAAGMLKNWKLTLAELEKIVALTAAAQLLDLLSLPLDNVGAVAPIERFLRTSRLIRLRDSLPETQITLLEVLTTLAAGAYATPTDFAAAVQGVNETWLAAEVEGLIASLDLAYPADYLLTENWERLRRAFYFLENLNAGAGVVKTFAAAAMTDSHAKTIKELLRSKFGGETWLTLSAEIQDVLRERKRDALAAYLLAQVQPADAPTGKWENTNDLYAYYLLDVEMSSCQLTSRLVQGSGSIQLFVQRCFMGLEPDVEVKADGDKGDSAWRWWKWMRKYRVWEANRKVFLWPENWIEPELKKDRSPFFKDLENELLQNEINQDSVEKAFANYLEKLDGVAQLEIAGFFQEDDGDNTIIHVFGRTPGAEPHLYYYRRYDYRQWTPWEKVELDIQGDYLIPAVVNKRLYLTWPVFTEVPDEERNSTVTMPDTTKSSFTPDKAKKRLRLQLAVSDYRQGKWTPTRTSKDFVESGFYDNEIRRKHYRFFPIDRSDVDGRFAVECEGRSSAGSESNPVYVAYLSGAFEISGCKGIPEKTRREGYFTPAIQPEINAAGERTTYLKWVELGPLPQRRGDDPADDFSLENRFLTRNASSITRILAQTPGIFQIAPPWHLSYLDKMMLDGLVGLGFGDRDAVYLPTGTWLPFFYNDKKRTFFVLPSTGRAIYQRAAETSFGGISSVTHYYPDVKKSFRTLEDFFAGLVQSWLDTFDPKTLFPAQLRALSGQFPEEPLPPYTDDQIKQLLKRWIMRFFHAFLGGWALLFYQFRRFHFKNCYHPFVCDFAKLVYNPLKGIPALMSRETQLKNSGFSFERVYQPTTAVVKLPPPYPSLADCYPEELVDFTPDGTYSSYNWELFFHAPLLIANSLSTNQRFEEARDWYHFIFNPIGLESAVPGGSAMSKYWITKPFFETTEPQYVQQRIDNLLRLLAGDTTIMPGYSTQAQKDLEDQVLDWRTNPFEPHRIANYRTVAYQKTVVMKYLDNLIAWGDYLFAQDSMESINEATQLYILAAEILGPRPKKIPPQTKPAVESFNELEKEFDKFSNALVELENLVPPLPGNGQNGADPAPLPMLYFCIPQNDKMLSYWDTVADRLYKIRHCMNIEGVVRQLALFEPPIDPGALVKAVAAGLDISSALADLNAPRPLYRFNLLLQKANEICSDVKALGGALLAALEKKDAEALAALRQSQEIHLLEAVKTVREKQIDEAKQNLAGLHKNKELVRIRRDFYQDIEKINASEDLHQKKLEEALVAQQISQVFNIAASVAHIVPTFDLGVSGVGGSPRAAVMFGGPNVGSGLQAVAGGFTVWANVENYNANKALTNAGHERRWDDWKHQEKLANKELEQVDRSIAAGELRIAIAEKELENHKLQIENAMAIDAFMHSKYTNQELYQWQVRQISGVYFQSYRLAYDLAKRAERCFRFELGLQDSSYINFGYWDSLKKGLLSGEKLQFDLRRLESAYLEQNRREFELTKNISLVLLNPLALIQLKETGRCSFRLPEEIFDLDYPGHYFRRIKSVSLTLPCVVGPYTNISCTLRQLKNSIRISTSNGDNGYPRNTDGNGSPADDVRFVENNIPFKAVAASHAQNDSGVFELNFRDERYLPFEGAGAISEWSLELFNDLPSNNPDFGKPLRQFDYNTISDAILHVKYTAREDAGPFKNGAVAHLRNYYSQDETTPSLRMLNLRHDFPTQWHRFLNPANPAAGNVLEFEMSPTLFPFRDVERTLKINKILLLARCTDPGSYAVVLAPPLPPPAAPTPDPNKMTLTRANQYGGLHFQQKDTSALRIEVLSTGPPVKWQLKMTRPGGGNLQEDPVKKVPEVEDIILVLGYEWDL